MRARDVLERRVRFWVGRIGFSVEARVRVGFRVSVRVRVRVI